MKSVPGRRFRPRCKKSRLSRGEAHQKSLDLEGGPSAFFVEEFYGAVFEGQFFEPDGKDAALPDFGENSRPFGVLLHYCRGVVVCGEAFISISLNIRPKSPMPAFMVSALNISSRLS